MPPIVDSHVHIFPYLGGPSGFRSEDEHRRFLQLYMGAHGEPVRRLRDHARVAEQTLHDGTLANPASLRDVDFRVGSYGRFEWTAGGEELYLQFFPPHLQEMTSPPEFMLQQMARAGVDVGVLQNARLYGRLNEYFAEAVRRYPGKFIGLADVEEAAADTDAEIARLRHAVRELGLKGLYYANRGLFADGYRRAFDDPSFDPLWEEVRALGIPVFWELVGVPDPTDPAALLPEIDRLDRWAGRWPDIPGVWTHGFAPQLLAEMPEPLAALLGRDQMMVEILYPIHWARDHEYPFPELRPALQTLHARLGGERLVWGSDIPNVERNCTYRQSLHYLRMIGEGIIPAADLDRVLGLNVLRLLGAGAPTAHVET
jgi:predicted TIM-barrel fold metal-dependent hydrolase